MNELIAIKVIAQMHCDFSTKFGIPRQSGLVKALKGTVVFAPEYRNPDAVRGLEGFSHIWLIWQFSEAVREGWSPMVRPPRMGGNTRMGVFATRSPFRPNAIGLSSVKLDRVEFSPTLGPVLHVSGADLMDGTPILDIKPYLPGVDSHPEICGPVPGICVGGGFPRGAVTMHSGKPPGGPDGCLSTGPAPIVPTRPGAAIWPFICGL